MAAARDEINPPLSPIKKNKRGQVKKYNNKYVLFNTHTIHHQ